MSEFFEIAMIICFGLSWPMNVYKSYKTKSTKGKSLMFLCFIFIGYVAGIISKFMNESYMNSFNEKWYVLIFYFINITMVSLDIGLFIRNKRFEKLTI